MDKKTIEMLNKQLRLIDFRTIELPFIDIDVIDRPAFKYDATDISEPIFETFRFYRHEGFYQLSANEHRNDYLIFVLHDLDLSDGKFPFCTPMRRLQYVRVRNGQRALRFDTWALNQQDANHILREINMRML